MYENAVKEICEASDKLLRELNHEKYNNLSGLKSKSDLQGVFKNHPDFKDPGAFMSTEEIQTLNETEEAGLKLVRAFLARTFLEAGSANLRDQILNTESGAVITCDTRPVSYRSAIDEIRNETKRSNRERIDRTRREIVLSLNPLYLKLFEALHRGSEELGFPTYLNLLDYTEGVGVIALGIKARRFLTDTDYVYRDLLRWFLRKRMELKQEELTVNDLHHLFSSFELREKFPKSMAAVIAGRIFAEMDIEVTRNLKIDCEKRYGKISGSICLPSGVTNRVLCSINPIGGIEDYESYLETLGKALSYTHTEPDAPFEFRMLRDSTCLEVPSQLFKNLVYQPMWIKRYLKDDPGRDFLEFLYLRRLSTLRYYCGKFIYESLVHESLEQREISEHYADTLKEATLAKHDKADYLIEIEPFLFSAVYLNAAFLEVSLSAFLRDTFDEEWWRIKEAGNFIVNLFKDGGRITSRDLAKKCGLKEIDSTPLIISFQNIFNI